MSYILGLSKVFLRPNTTIFFEKFQKIEPEQFLNDSSYSSSLVINFPQNFYDIGIHTNYDEDTDPDAEYDDTPIYYKLQLNNECYYFDDNVDNNSVSIPSNILDKYEECCRSCMSYIYERCLGSSNNLNKYGQKYEIVDNFIFFIYFSNSIDHIDFSGIDFVILFNSNLNLQHLSNYNVKEIILVEGFYQHENIIRIKYGNNIPTKNARK